MELDGHGVLFQLPPDGSCNPVVDNPAPVSIGDSLRITVTVTNNSSFRTTAEPGLFFSFDPDEFASASREGTVTVEPNSIVVFDFLFVVPEDLSFWL